MTSTPTEADIVDRLRTAAVAWREAHDTLLRLETELARQRTAVNTLYQALGDAQKALMDHLTDGPT